MSVWSRVRYVVRLAAGHGATAVAVAVLGLGVPMAACVALELTDAGWGAAEWVALVAGLWTTFWFFVVALVLNASGERRAAALANAAVDLTVGALAVAGSRTFAGDDDQALRIPHDALAALAHYEAAGGKQRKALLDATQAALADVVFATVARADTLPRTMWDRLGAGAKALRSRLLVVMKDEVDDGRREQLRRTRELAGLCVELGTALRTRHWSLAGGGRLDLETVLEDAIGDPTNAGTVGQLALIESLYRNELAVVKKWEVLQRAPTSLHLSVTLEDVSNAAGWFTPWYVEREGITGELSAVNVCGKELDEAAGRDRLPEGSELPAWPTPLRHGEVPAEMRTAAIERARKLLNEQDPVTVCVLLYELATGERLVLDGNHRLAGALKLSGERGRDPADRCPVRVLAFRLSEREPITTVCENRDERPDRTEVWAWEGSRPTSRTSAWEPRTGTCASACAAGRPSSPQPARAKPPARGGRGWGGGRRAGGRGGRPRSGRRWSPGRRRRRSRS